MNFIVTIGKEVFDFSDLGVEALAFAERASKTNCEHNDCIIAIHADIEEKKTKRVLFERKEN